MNKVEKIKAEIERLKSSLHWGSCASQLSMECNCKNEAYNEVLSYIDSLEEDPVSNYLEEAAYNFVMNNFGNPKEPPYKFDQRCFKAGAQWQKQQDQSTIELAEDHAYLAGQEKIIDKACEWLETQLDNYLIDSKSRPYISQEGIKKFRKAMEE